MTRYLNMKTGQFTETVDELSRKDFRSTREFKKELQRLVAEYRLSGMSVYVSQRPDRSWK